jgi:CheY-like chemotaxis protein
MALDPKSRQRINLSKTVVLLLDPSQTGLSILSQILNGLGARNIHRCSTIEEAKDVAEKVQIDLMIIDTISATGDGYAFVRWLRKNVPPPNRHAPVLLTTGHTRTSDVKNARDCGSHFIVAKPLAPVVMLERIIWIVKQGRPFLLSDNYIGPDRRFGKREPPANHPRRRHDDEPARAANVDGPDADDSECPVAPLERAS